jgi:hypothetical protein
MRTAWVLNGYCSTTTSAMPAGRAYHEACRHPKLHHGGPRRIEALVSRWF